MYQDKTLVCRDCGAEFVFTAGEQEFYARRASRTSPPAARNAVRPARRTALPLLVRCMRDLRCLWQAHDRPLHSQERPPHLLQRVLRRSPAGLIGVKEQRRTRTRGAGSSLFFCFMP